MKRAGPALLALAVLGAVVLAAGRPPSRYVLESEAARFQQERREHYTLFTRAIAQAAVAKEPTADLKRQLDEGLFRPRSLRLGGWDVHFLPPGAKPPRSGLARWGSLDPGEPRDGAPLRGDWEVRMEPVSWSARLTRALGLGPADDED